MSHPEEESAARWEGYKHELRSNLEGHFFFDSESFTIVFAFVATPEHAAELPTVLRDIYRSAADRELVVQTVGNKEEVRALLDGYMGELFLGKDVAVSVFPPAGEEEQKAAIAGMGNLNLREALKRRSSGLVLIVPSALKSFVVTRFPDLYTQRNVSLDENLPIVK
ncbi:hypothetical protein EBS80_03375 [bacterium]|nr:hypothetical protein [bacterium]